MRPQRKLKSYPRSDGRAIVSRNLAIVAEDKLTQAVLHKCIEAYLPNHNILRSDVTGGRGNVQKHLAAYAKLASTMPVIIGVDLDHDICAPNLLTQWQAGYQPTENLLIRVAVHEVESWVLADRKRIAKFIDAESDSITKDPDSLADPKRAFLDLARASASEELKRDLVPRNYNQYPRIGPAYNLQMCKFVMDKWRPHVALRRSDSLARAITALELLAG